jgi:hypothetical protein
MDISSGDFGILFLGHMEDLSHHHPLFPPEEKDWFYSNCHAYAKRSEQISFFLMFLTNKTLFQ